MKIHDLIQGSPEWLAYRAQHFNASDAPAMMGVSPYKTRGDLLRELHTGVAAEADAGQQRRFDDGHRFEAMARPLAEKIIGDELYPVVGSEGRLSASFDGLTLNESQGFEHKTLNAELRAAFEEMLRSEHGDAPCRLLPLTHRIQMEQQLLVSGAERILFMASQWDAEGNLIEERHCLYYPDAKLRQAIVDGWSQFERDLAAYVLPDAAPAAPVGKAPETLPALRIEVTGAVTASNLAEFKATALGAIRAVNRTLKTDQDFADAEKAVKWCADVEDRLKAAKEHALSQTADIDALFKALDDISAEARTVRLDLGKLVTRRKTEVKEGAVAAARKALDLHVAAVNSEIAPMALRLQPVDFAGAIKGLRSFASMQDALDTALAAAKIEADTQGRLIRANVATFKTQAEGLEFLFHDLGQVVHKAADDFSALVSARIATHKAAEEARELKRKADEAARIAAAEKRAREEEAARIEQEQRRQQQAAAEAARASAADAERLRIERESQAQAADLLQKLPEAVRAGAIEPDRAERIGGLVASLAADSVITTAKAGAIEPATLKLGAICDRLGFTVSAAFLADTLRITPAKTEGASKLYTEAQFRTACRRLIDHINDVVSEERAT